MTIDERLFKLPLIGSHIRRMFSYFSQHIFFTDMVHISAGIGIGLLLVGGRLFPLGVVGLCIGVAGHLFAYSRGKE